MTDAQKPDFSNDRPLSNKSDDRLNRAPFADRIAKVFKELPLGTGMVVGIHGPWGDGKTTVLNILRGDLEQSTNLIPVEFNPWRFTDEASMLAGFFRVLAGTIRAKLTTKGEDIAGWLEKLGRYASVVDERFGGAADLAGKQSEVSLEELRRRLSDALSKADKRIVVLVDDIDRLDKQETHTLFRLIKACADFPNVCYVLAFDDAAVAKALGERYGGGDEGSGRAFLEKIIQVPLKLPVAGKEDLRALCFEQVDQALVAAGIELTREDVGEFFSGFDRGASVRLTTPRAAKRYGNALMFALPMLKGEAHPADLLLIEALRAFFPEVYDVVRENHADFSGVERDRRGRGEEGTRAGTLLKPVLDPMPKQDSDAVKALLIDLFPRLSGVYGNTNYGSDWLARWSKERRISSPEYCPRYFTYTIPRSDIADAEVADLVAAASKADAVSVNAILVKHLTGTKARRLVEKLRALETSLDQTSAATLGFEMAKLAKNIPNPPALFSVAEAPAQAAILISNLLARIPQRDARVAAAKQVMSAAEPLWFAVECMRWIHVTDNPEKQERNTLTAEETAEVRRTVVSRIKTRAAAGEVLFDPEVPQEDSQLYEWWRQEGREPVEAYLLGLFTKDPSQIGRFLRSQAPLGWSEGAALPRVGQLDTHQLKNIKLVVDLDKLAALIRRHCAGDFDNPEWFPNDQKPLEQRLAEQFMFIHNKWVKEGEPSEGTVEADTAAEENDSEPDGVDGVSA